MTGQSPSALQAGVTAPVTAKPAYQAGHHGPELVDALEVASMVARVSNVNNALTGWKSRKPSTGAACQGFRGVTMQRGKVFLPNVFG